MGASPSHRTLHAVAAFRRDPHAIVRFAQRQPGARNVEARESLIRGSHDH